MPPGIFVDFIHFLQEPAEKSCSCVNAVVGIPLAPRLL